MWKFAPRFIRHISPAPAHPTFTLDSSSQQSSTQRSILSQTLFRLLRLSSDCIRAVGGVFVKQCNLKVRPPWTPFNFSHKSIIFHHGNFLRLICYLSFMSALNLCLISISIANSLTDSFIKFFAFSASLPPSRLQTPNGCDLIGWDHEWKIHCRHNFPVQV